MKKTDLDYINQGSQLIHIYFWRNNSLKNELKIYICYGTLLLSSLLPHDYPIHSSVRSFACPSVDSFVCSFLLSLFFFFKKSGGFSFFGKGQNTWNIFMSLEAHLIKTVLSPLSFP